MSRWLLVVLVCLLAAAHPGAAARTVTLATRQLSATFHEGTLVGLRNEQTGEQYFAAAAGQPAPALVALAGRSEPLPAIRLSSSGAVPGGHRWVAVTGGEQPATITTTVTLDEATGGFLVSQQVSRPRGGIAGVEWGWHGLDLGRVRLVIPAAGGVVIDPARSGNPLHFEWPGGWQAAALFVQGKRGGCWLWSDDPARHFKDLHYRLAQGRATLRFGTQSDGPPEAHTRFQSVTWRVAPYRGSWQAPAAAYRSLMAKSFSLQPLSRRQPWVSRIALVVRTGALPGPADLTRLAAQIAPDRVLFYLPDWRTLGYDVNYPEYTPRPEVAAWIRAARGMGFHVMIHCNWAGLNPRHPLRAQYDRLLLRDRWTKEPVGWYLDRPHDPDHQIMVLNTAFPEARQLMIGRIRQAVQAAGADAVHLDFPVLINSTHGRVGNLNALGGAERYLRELQAALPGVAIGTEGIHEPLLQCSFAQLGEIFWNQGERMGSYHPIRAFLFADYCHLYGHLGMPDAASSLPGFVDATLVGLRLASLPTLSIHGDPIPWQAQGVDLALTLGRAWARDALRPHFALKAGETMAWQGQRGRVALTRSASGWMLQGASEASFLLVEGANTTPPSWVISGWPAQDQHGAFGLDPSRRYLARAGQASHSAVALARPAQPVVITEHCLGEQRASFTLSVPRQVAWSAERSMGLVKAQVLVRGRLLPLQGAAHFTWSAAPCLGVRREGILAHPPWQGSAAGGATVGEFWVAVPSVPRLRLRFATGMADIEHDPQADPGDGATFSISVDGQRLFRRHHPRGTGWQEGELDFTPYRGKTVTLRLITEPGPAGDTSFDWAYWSDVRLEAESQAVLPAVELVSERPAAATVPPAECVGERPYRYRFPGGTPTLQAALLYRVTPVTLPARLAELPFATAAVAGGIGMDMSVYGSGTTGYIALQGQELPGINAHTPNLGQTRLDWALALPAQPCRLRLHYGVREGGEGVRFLAVVNGETLWTQPVPTPVGWQEAALDLGRWAGQTVLLSLVTDAEGSNNCDWAWWGEPRLEAMSADSPPD